MLVIFPSAVTDYPTDINKWRKYLFELVVSVPHGREGTAALKTLDHVAKPCISAHQEAERARPKLDPSLYLTM